MLFCWPPLASTGWKRPSGFANVLTPRTFCPAAGQGSLGIETRKDAAATMAALAFLDDPATRYGGDCRAVPLFRP